MRLALQISLRFLKSGRGQTILIALGIAIGVAVQVFIGALIQGLQNSLLETTIGSSSHITISSDSDEKTIRDWQRTMTEASLASKDIQYVSPAVSGSAFLDYDTDTSPVLIRGFDLALSDPIYNFSTGVIAGQLPQKRDDVLIGRDLADKASLQLGDRITVIVPSGGKSRLTITGIFDLKVASLNKTWLVTNLETAQSVLGLGNRVSTIEMQVNEVFLADEISAKVKLLVSEEKLIVENWKELNESLLSGLNGQSVSSAMIQVFVLVAVLLGISSVLAISVVQRQKQLGILKAMGIKDRDASLIFVFQGMFLGLIGGALGITFGLGLLYSFTTFALRPDGTPVIPILIDPGFIALSATFALVSAMIASLIPARLSSRLNPIEVIKNG